MELQRLKTVVFVLGISATATAGAYVIGGSNFTMSRYPEPDCDAPYSKPTRPYSDDKWAIDQYNREVERYNDDLREFRRCGVEYIENANNDIRRIQEAVQDLVSESNRL